MPLVDVVKNGAVTTVIIDRVDVRNAVDRPTAEALAEAFRAFDADPDARVGVLAGAHGTFCAGMAMGRWGRRAWCSASR
jgi:enoyl-CoA hydratase